MFLSNFTQKSLLVWLFVWLVAPYGAIDAADHRSGRRERLKQQLNNKNKPLPQAANAVGLQGAGVPIQESKGAPRAALMGAGSLIDAWTVAVLSGDSVMVQKIGSQNPGCINQELSGGLTAMH